jgi:tetratricopeptide (TPR) repeat protein
MNAGARAVSRVEAAVRHARELIADRAYAQALATAEAILAEVPENRDVLYLVAVSQRYLGRIADALRTLLRLEQLHPDYGRLFQERGHCYRAVGESDLAMAAYAEAGARNPTLQASWQALEAMQRAAGMTVAADAATAQLRALASLPVEVVSAKNLYSEGDLFGAERAVRGLLKTHGDHVEAMRLLAQIATKLDVLDDAELLLERLLQLAPGYHAARHELAIVLAKRHRFVASLAEARRLLETDPHNASYRAAYANACVGVGDHGEALRLYRELAAELPGVADLHLSVGHALKTLGRQSEAIASYRAAVAARPAYGDAYWSLANLKTYAFSEEEFGAMLAAEAAPSTSHTDRCHLCFALGKALEDRGDYAQSFRYYASGNALRRRDAPYEADDVERNTRRQIEICTAEFFAQRRGTGCESAGPIFIVGLPRSGSTLIEQILASHSAVEGTMELAEIPQLVHRLEGQRDDRAAPGYPAILRGLGADQLRALGQEYLDATRAYRCGRPYFVDKMPNNFRHLGLIHLILPNARIIDARREPMACCFSNFKQLFAFGQEFTYSLSDIARYYRTYVELMRHWDAVLPGRVLRVQYEDVVADLENNVRRILEFCGLDFEPQCVEFYRTERSVRTASSEQVRRPIFREGLNQWRHYETWLTPLADLLGDALQNDVR